MVDALNQAMRHAEQVMSEHIRDDNLGQEAYETFVALTDPLTHLPGADAWAAGIEGLRFTGTLVYQRPVAEVERAMRAALAPLDINDPDQIMPRIHTAGAAYTTYPELRPYFDREVAAVAQMPESELRTNLLASIERVRATVQRTSDPEVSNDSGDV